MSDRSSWYCVLCVLAFACGGCRLVSIEEEDVPFFEVTIADVRLEGVGAGRMEQEHVFQLWGQFVYPDSSFRFIQFSIANSEKTGTYSLGQFVGSYGLINNRERVVRLAASSGNSDDNVRIDRFGSSGIVQGTFSFEATALRDFDNIPYGEHFTIQGQFLIELP